MDDQILLAELIGWERCDKWWGKSPTWRFLLLDGTWKIATSAEDLPNPFTDANADYAMLVYARDSWLTRDPPNPDKPEWDAFCEAIWAIPTLYGSLLFYRIGDYARAVLRVINHR